MENAEILKKEEGAKLAPHDLVKNHEQDTKNNKVISIKKGQSLNDLEANNEKSKGNTIIHIVEDYLSKKYNLRFNEISIELELSENGKNDWQPLNEHALWIEIKKVGINIPMNTLISVLKSGFVPKYNPIKYYFEQLPKWDTNADYINEYASFILLENENERDQFNYHFKKWVVRTIKCALEPNYFNKQAFIISDDGLGQDIGKTSWCRHLCPTVLKDYFAEDIGKDKDSRILLCKNFLINLDELAALSKQEINHLKAFFSKDQINERLPYDKKNTILKRCASFIGSTNMSTFLQDETGSVRWIIFTVRKIDWSYRDKININNLWSQAFYLAYHDKNFKADFTPEDVRENERRNDKYTVVSTERDLILKFYKIPNSNEHDKVKFLTPTEILVFLKTQTNLRLSPVGIGKALKSLGYIRVKEKGVYGYYVEKLNADFSNLYQ